MTGTTERGDAEVRAALYEHTIARGVPPRIAELSQALQRGVEQVREALARLAAARALVLQPKSGEVLMANPFSAVPTPFAVRSGEARYHGNCVWDALGIPAMLRRDGVVETSCGCCGEAMGLRVEEGRLAPAAGVVHFAVPARRWWEDIVFS